MDPANCRQLIAQSLDPSHCHLTDISSLVSDSGDVPHVTESDAAVSDNFALAIQHRLSRTSHVGSGDDCLPMERGPIENRVRPADLISKAGLFREAQCPPSHSII